MSYSAKVARLSMELALAVSDYNSKINNNLDDVIKATLIYLENVKELFTAGEIDEKQLNEFFALVGQSWASVQGREFDEKIEDSESKK
jgi:hypothetical protein